MGERGVVYRCTVCGEQYDIRGRVWLHVEAVHRDIQRERMMAAEGAMRRIIMASGGDRAHKRDHSPLARPTSPPPFP